MISDFKVGIVYPNLEVKTFIWWWPQRLLEISGHFLWIIPKLPLRLKVPLKLEWMLKAAFLRNLTIKRLKLGEKVEIRPVPAPFPLLTDLHFYLMSGGWCGFKPCFSQQKMPSGWYENKHIQWWQLLLQRSSLYVVNWYFLRRSDRP